MITLDVLKAAARILGILAGGESLSATDADALLSTLNRTLDSWNAERAAVYRETINTFALTPSLQPHTLGPTGVWVLSQRPESIAAATLLLADLTRIPIDRHQGPDGALWWADIRVQTVKSSVPTDVFFDPGWPNGSLYFWPVPSAAYSVELVTRIVLADLGLNDSFSLPPGYLDTLVLTLVEDAASDFGAQIPESVPSRAARARGRIWGINTPTPYIGTADTGLETEGVRSYNWHLGPFGSLRK